MDHFFFISILIYSIIGNKIRTSSYWMDILRIRNTLIKTKNTVYFASSLDECALQREENQRNGKKIKINECLSTTYEQTETLKSIPKDVF